MGQVRIVRGFDLDRMAMSIEDAVMEDANELVAEIYNSLTQVTAPVLSGTLRYSWKASPRPGDYEPTISRVPNHYPMPDKMTKDDMPKVKWASYSVYNNQPYIAKVNDSARHRNFVQKYVQSAVDKVNAKP